MTTPYHPGSTVTLPAEEVAAVADALYAIEVQPLMPDPADGPDDRHLAYARALGRVNGLASGPRYKLLCALRRADLPRVPTIPPSCHCGSRLSIDTRTATLDARHGTLSATGECDHCGSTYVVSTGMDVAAYLRDDPDTETDDDDLSDTALRSKRDDAAMRAAEKE